MSEAPTPLVLRWRVPTRRIALGWRGPRGMVSALERRPTLPVAGIVGPPGPPGGVPLRLDAALGATWTLPHPLGRVPAVQVFLATGETVLADVQAGETQITVSFPSPQQGFVLAF